MFEKEATLATLGECVVNKILRTSGDFARTSDGFQCGRVTLLILLPAPAG